MIAFRGRGMHIRNTADIPSNCKDIRIQIKRDEIVLEIKKKQGRE